MGYPLDEFVDVLRAGREAAGDAAVSESGLRQAAAEVFEAPQGTATAPAQGAGTAAPDQAVDEADLRITEAVRPGGQPAGEGLSGNEIAAGWAATSDLIDRHRPGSGPPERPPLDPTARYATSDQWIDQIEWVLGVANALHEPYQAWREQPLPPQGEQVQRLRGIGFAAMAAHADALLAAAGQLAAACEPVARTAAPGGWSGAAADAYLRQLGQATAGVGVAGGDLRGLGTALGELAGQLHAVVRDLAVEVNELVGGALGIYQPAEMAAMVGWVRGWRPWLDEVFGDGLTAQVTCSLDQFADTYEQAVRTLGGLVDAATSAVADSAEAFAGLVGGAPERAGGGPTDAPAADAPVGEAPVGEAPADLGPASTGLASVSSGVSSAGSGADGAGTAGPDAGVAAAGQDYGADHHGGASSSGWAPATTDKPAEWQPPPIRLEPVPDVVHGGYIEAPATKFEREDAEEPLGGVSLAPESLRRWKEQYRTDE